MDNVVVKHVESDQLTIAVRCAGRADKPAFVLLHGWPQCAVSFDRVAARLAGDFFVLAPDLPGVGSSRGLPASGEKSMLAPHVESVIAALRARDVILAGHDVGGMVAFACFQRFGAQLAGGAILNTVIPGIDPWDKVLANPHVWHFAFHAIPRLPEKLVAGRERAYFDYFFDILADVPERIGPSARELYARAYGRPEALKAGFDWYRAMPADAKRNRAAHAPALPLLCIRGEKDAGDIEDYLSGLRNTGITDIAGRVIPGGHFSADESPDALAQALREFRAQCDARR
jgi:pimeloyl-ACP methyl ester carboxylesterase